MTATEELASGKLSLDHPADAVARLTIQNEAKRNALDHEILGALASALLGLDRGIEVRCVLITGAGSVFSAGYDIADIPEESFSVEAESLVAHPFHAAMEAISTFPYPVVAAINGHCLGGGLELAVRCDLRVCASGAKLGMPPAKLGLVYGHTGLQKFIEAIGVPRTKELFLIGRNVSAEWAARAGLVHSVVGDGDLPQAGLELATEIASGAPISLRGNKHAIGTLAGAVELTPDVERELVELRRSCFESADFREGVRAFAEKRAPRWTGR